MGRRARVPFLGDGVVTIDRVSVAVELASRGSATRGSGDERFPVAKEHPRPVDGAGIGPRVLARIVRFSEGRVAVEVTTGGDGASPGSTAVAPETEFPVAANERRMAIGGACVIEGRIGGTRISDRRDGVVAVIRRAAALAASRTAAPHVRPYARTTHRRAVGPRTEKLFGDATRRARGWLRAARPSPQAQPPQGNPPQGKPDDDNVRATNHEPSRALSRFEDFRATRLLANASRLREKSGIRDLSHRLWAHRCSTSTKNFSSSGPCLRSP